MCGCTQMHIIHIYMHTYVHIHRHTYHTYTHYTHMYTCEQGKTHMCMHLCTQRHTCRYTDHTHIHTHHSPGVEIRGQTQVFTFLLVQDKVSCSLLCPPSRLAQELPKTLSLPYYFVTCYLHSDLRKFLDWKYHTGEFIWASGSRGKRSILSRREESKQ